MFTLQMICERRNRSKEVKQKIREYLEGRCPLFCSSSVSVWSGVFHRWVWCVCVTDRFYVPLLRAADNTLPPEISVPWCPGSPESCDRFYRPDRMMDSPKNPTKIIKAFVGPLNSSKVVHTVPVKGLETFLMFTFYVFNGALPLWISFGIV